MVPDEQHLMLELQWYQVSSISMVSGEQHLIGGPGEQHFKPSGGQRLIGGQGEQHLTLDEIRGEELHRGLGGKVSALKGNNENSTKLIHR